jgi:methylmalonyl-CoA mutase N-terminal domain/subunit
VDPLAGSYFVETLTKQMEERIEAERHRVREVGGMIQAVSSGFAQKLVAEQAYQWERGLKTGEYVKIGVNKYVDEEEPEVELHEYDPTTQLRQVEALAEVKRERSDADVKRGLNRLESAAKAKENVMPALVECCTAYATVGEMAGVFRNVFGEFKEPTIF